MTTDARRIADKAVIAGIGETPAVRRSGLSAPQMILAAVEQALADAGFAPEDVDGIVTEDTMQSVYPHDEFAATLKIPGPYLNATSSYFGSGIASAHQVAAALIASGQASVVVTYFGVDWGTSSGAYSAVGAAGSPKEIFEKPYGYYGQPYFFGAIATRYRHEYGIDLEPALGSIAVNQRANAILSGTAQMTKPMSYEDYLASPLVAEPLRVPDCCLLSDGAAATVLVSAERAANLRNRPVYLKGAALSTVGYSMDNYFSQNAEYLSWPTARAAVQRALSMAGHTLAELDFAELYDCFTMTLLMQIEDIGWCDKGEAASFVEGGKRIALDGDIPVNTHGGLLSHSYLLGATHITEAVRQLRGTAGPVQVNRAELGLVGLLAGPHYGALVLGSQEG